ncbi:LysR substrate-binding domain-containing protein [Magnetospirillum sulfuroxidans]|uniref:LysR family transcriptional regulator n=1 Tax=Magnetospirillum sulfuroxidans TaxID=611300 RepID=A0ABS5I7L5_9PROT|nr:LysR substrate-binding domain-containing protein [Magnetospirillum sulfuroxidans]MBR9970424.1 LysR family transcriptional regulator [Magnetospirillum sulfuroxidans]
MRDLNDLYFFTQVVEHGGFSAAGRVLGVPKSKLSRRVAQLEDGLGVRLLQRSSRRFALTEMGQAYYRHCRAMVIEAEAAEEVIEHSQAEAQGTIRMSCPVSLAQARMGAIIAEFLVAHPKVRIHLEATNRRVDVIEEGFDVALRVRQPPLEDSDLIVKVLEQHQSYLVASPAFLDRHGRPHSPADLAGLQSLAMTRAGDRHSWLLTDVDGGEIEVPHQPRLVTDDMVTLRHGARAGLGIVQLPSLMVEEDLYHGRLEKTLTAWTPPRGLVHAVFPSRRGLVPAIRLFLDALAAAWVSV